MKPTLFLLAAGMGSRYGGLKQLDGLGPNGETIMDYSIYDAIQAGFGKIVWVIRKDFEEQFRTQILSKYEGKVQCELCFQALDALPEGFTVPEGRQKPWGTNHAVLMGKDVIKEPRVGNTLSENGTVARGICSKNDKGHLTTVVERTEIVRCAADGSNAGAATEPIRYKDEQGQWVVVEDNTPVSMNMWGFTPDYFEYSEAYFREFLSDPKNMENLKAEFFIPLMVNKLITDGTATVEVLDTTSKWFGVTYAADRDLNEAQLSQLDQLIASADTILITCHKSPDGDAIGSCLGWAEYLRTREKEAIVIVPDQYPDFLQWLPNSEKIVRYDKHPEKCDMLFKIADLVFCLDFNATSRVQDMEATLVFRIVWQLGGFDRLDKRFAIPVYCGMMTDTGGFLYNSTRPEIYFIIGELLTKHIDKDRIYRNVYHNYSEDRIRLMGYVMYEKLVYLPELHTAFYTITREEQKRFHFIKGDAEGLVNIPQQIKGLKLSISLREDSEKPRIWVSLRSVDQFPCNKMAAEFFNGGGHLNASGGHLDMTIDEAVQVVREAIIAYAEQLKR